MNLLVVGNGGREHALAWRLAQSDRVTKVFVAPGNAGTALTPRLENLPITDIDQLIEFVKSNNIAFTVVGPEAPLAAGIVDKFRAAGLRIFGPTKAAAQLESSKDFAKAFMKRHNIPTADYESFTDPEAAHAYVRRKGAPIVVKADGLAAGKGVIVAMTLDEALDAVHEIMDDAAFGKAGSRVVIEEFMDGEEASLLAFTDGKTICPMVSSQDHKRAYDGDKGPNTGGMGTYAPAPVMTDEMVKIATERILRPTIAAMAKEGRPYKGCLYAGLMITKEGPKVVEFNARFGDPETQVVLPLLKSDLVDIMLACADGTLDEEHIEWSDGAAVCVVIASGGYPKAYKKGFPIDGLEKAKALGTLVFHAGTAEKDGKIVTSGGRVLGVVATADNIRNAVDKAYKGVNAITFEGAFHRTDIAHRALERLTDK